MIEIVLNKINIVCLYIEPIFYKILYMSMIATIVGIIIAIIRRLLDKYIPPKWKCALWIVYIIALIVPINIKLNIDINNIIIQKLNPIQEISYREEYDNNKFSLKAYSQRENTNIDTYLQKKKNRDDSYRKLIIADFIFPITWVLGIVMFSIFFLYGMIRLRIHTGSKIVTDKKLLDILNECKHKLNIKKDIDIILQEYKKIPSIYKILDPEILITNELFKEDNKTIEYIFLHELAHYKRKDLLFNYLLIFINVIHWFNPFVWIFSKMIRQDIEIATDQYILQNLPKEEHKDYGRVLIEQLKNVSDEKYTSKVLCMADSVKNMARRIHMINLFKKFKSKFVTKSIISILIIILLFLIAFTNSKEKYESSLEQFDFNNVSKFAIPYVGDVSSVRKILDKLNLNELTNKIKLETKTEPYGIIVNYSSNSINDIVYTDFLNKKDIDKEYALEQNATALLSLIDNLGKVTLNILDKDGNVVYTYSNTRTNLENKYNIDLRKYVENPELFMEVSN